MRERLPGGEHGDGIAHHVAQFCGEILGFAAGRGHDDDDGFFGDRPGHPRPCFVDG